MTVTPSPDACSAGRFLVRPDGEWSQPCTRPPTALLLVMPDKRWPEEASYALCAHHYALMDQADLLEDPNMLN